MWRGLSAVGGVAVLLVLFTFSGCLKSTEIPCTQAVDPIRLANVNQQQLKLDVDAIDQYLTDNSITAVKDPSGLRYVISNEGDAARACLEKRILVTYSGKLMTNGTVFDSNTDGLVFNLSGLILGWQIGLLKVGRGGKITLYIPSVYGYGSQGSSKIPANSNLIFDVTLVDFDE